MKFQVYEMGVRGVAILDVNQKRNLKTLEEYRNLGVLGVIEIGLSWTRGEYKPTKTRKIMSGRSH